MAGSAVGIRLDGDTQARLKALGKLRDRSPHHLMKEAIEKYLSDEEALESEKRLMAERYEAYELTGEFIAHDDMKDWAASLTSSSSRSPQ